MVWRAGIPLLRRGWLRLLLAASPVGVSLINPQPAAAQGAGLQQQWQNYNRAMALFEGGRAAQARGALAEAESQYADADELLRGILLQNPARTDVYGPLGEVLVRRGRAAEAMVLLGRQVHDGNTDVRIRWPLALALRAMKQHRRALAEAREVLAQEPGHREALALLAATAMDMGDDATALPALRRLLDGADPARGALAESQTWRLWLGQVLNRRPGGALEALPLLSALAREALAPALVAPVARALALAQCRSHDAAQRRQGLAMLATLVDNRGAAAALASEPAGRGGAATALEAREQAELWLALAEGLLREQRPQEALAPLRRLVARAPQQPRSQLLLVRALLETGEPARAAEATGLLARLGESVKDPELLGDLGRAQLLSGNLRAAALTLRKAAAAAPGDVALCVELGTALARLGAPQAQAAQDEARRCQVLAPEDAGVLGLQAGLAVAAGRLGEGIGIYRQAARLVPGAAALRTGLGQALLQRGLAALHSGPALTAPVARGALPDVREAHELLATPSSARALAVAQLALGSAADAVATLRPHVERSKEEVLLLLYSRALREAGRLDAAAQALAQVRAPQARGTSWLWRQEQVLTLHQQQRAAEACQSFDREGRSAAAEGRGGPALDGRESRSAEAASAEALERLWALSCLGAARAAVTASALSASPPLVSLGAVHGPELSRPALLSPAAATTALGTALRLRSRLQDAEWVEAELLQSVLQARAGQAEAALKRLQALETSVAAPHLRQLLGPGGFDELLMQVALRAGQLPLAAQRAATAAQQMSPAQGARVRKALAAGYVSRAVIAYERSDFDRAFILLKVPAVQAELASKPGVVAYDLGAVQLARGRREEALALWGKIDAKELPEKWLALGAYHDAVGDRRNALENYKRYLQVVPPSSRHAEQVRRWVEAIQRFYSGAAAPGSAAILSEGEAPRTMGRRSNEPRREVAR